MHLSLVEAAITVATLGGAFLVEIFVAVALGLM